MSELQQSFCPKPSSVMLFFPLQCSLCEQHFSDMKSIEKKLQVNQLITRIRKSFVLAAWFWHLIEDQYVLCVAHEDVTWG